MAKKLTKGLRKEKAQDDMEEGIESSSGMNIAEAMVDDERFNE